MSIVLQWTIGCIAAFIIAVVLAVFRRECRTACIAAAVVLAGICALGFWKGPELFDAAKTVQVSEASGKKSSEEKDSLLVVSELLEAGDADSAAELLKEYAGNGNYSREYLSLLASVQEEMGNTDVSDRIKSRLEDNGANLKELEKGWKSSDKNARSAAAAYQAAKDLSRVTDLALEERGSRKDLLADWTEKGSPYAAAFPSLNRAFLAAKLYENNYSDLAEKVSDDPDGDTLIVVSQLFRKNRLNEDDFQKSEGRKRIIRESKTAADWLDQEIEKHENAYTEEELRFLKDKKEEFEETADGGKSAVERFLIDQMENKAEEHEESASKIYLELADRAYEEGKKDRGADYLAKSLETAAASEDGDYAAAAKQLNEILSETSDAEVRKQIDQYTREMAKNRMPQLVGDSIQEAADRSETAQGGEDTNTGSEDPDEQTGNKGEEDLASSMTNSLNQSLGAINIAYLDTTDFPKITAAVAVDESIAADETEFTGNLNLFDTDFRISSFTVQKMEYDQVNIVLVCDVSGSMSGDKIDNLKGAVRQFVSNAEADVNIALVPFNGGVLESQSCILGTDTQTVLDRVDSLRANGDTNIYAAVDYAADFFPGGAKELNMMLLLSDGRSNFPATVSEYEELKAKCLNKGISIYAVGLGEDVDANQMKEFAGYGGGEYYFISSPDAILDFYNYIYRLSKNRYSLTYTADDTMLINGRYMELQSVKNRSVSARRDYSLYSNDLDDEFKNPISVMVGDTVLSGLKEKTIYPSKISQTLTLQGKNIDKDAEISVELRGTASYDAISVTWQDDTSCAVVIPGRVATDVYDVIVTYNGSRRIFQNSLVVAGNDNNVIKFGKYVFTATNCDRSENRVLMYGVVKMNGWLGFKDKVSLTGDLKNDYEITMNCGKTYMQYTDGAKGLAGHYAETGYTLGLPYFSSIQLFNNPEKDVSDEDFPVRAVAPDASYLILDLFSLEATNYGLSLYPDRAVLDAQQFTTRFPFQDVLVRNVGADQLFHYAPEHSEKLIFSNNAIDCDIHFSLSNNKDDEYAATLGNMNIKLNLGEVGFDLNTKEGEVAITLKANVAMLCNGVGFKLAWKDWKFDEIGLYADYEYNTYIGNIPVTIHNFKLEANDISSVDLGNDFSSLFGIELKGGLDISMVKISSAFPGLENWIGDASIASLKNCELGFRLKEPRIRASADAEFLGFIDVGHAEAELGFGLDYTNPLLDFQHKPNGFAISVEVGPQVKLGNAELDLRIRGTLPLTDQIMGLGVHGEFYAKISWWVFVQDFRANGDLFAGLYRQTDGGFHFLVVGHGTVNGGGQGSFSVVWGDKDKILSKVDL